MPSRRTGRTGRPPPFSKMRALEPTLCGAIKKGYLRQVRYLLEFGRSANERDVERRTPLMHCALIADEEWAVGVARTLLEYGASVGMVDVRGLTALHYSCLMGRPLLLSVVLGAIDFDLNQQDRQGNTALHHAARRGDTVLGKLLVEALMKYDLSVDVRNKRGDTPLLCAWKAGQEDMAEYLVDTGHADEQATDRQGYSVNHWREVARTKAKTVQDQVDSVALREERRARIRERAKSAPVRGRLQNSKDIIPSKENTTHRLYRPASASNLRNQPENILNVTPKECFVTEAEFPLTHHRPSLALPEPLPASWRGHFRRMLTTYDFQFSPSYRRSVTEKVEDVDRPRAASPQPSETASETVSDMASISSKRSMVSRRSSILGKAGTDKKKLSVGKKRSSSFLAVCMAAIPDT